MKPGQSGAATVLTLLVLVVTGCGVTLSTYEVAALTNADARAGAAADAVAHASAVALAQYPDRDHLSIDAQANKTNCTYPAASSNDRSNTGCTLSWMVATLAAAHNASQLMSFVLGPDIHDVGAKRGPGDLVTLVEVAVPRHLPFLGDRCAEAKPVDKGMDICWAHAWSSAQEAG